MHTTSKWRLAAFAAAFLATFSPVAGAEDPETDNAHSVVPVPATVEPSPATVPLSPVVRIGKSPTRWICSGVFVAPDVVLSAGHCFDGAPTGTEGAEITLRLSDGTNRSAFIALVSVSDGGFSDFALLRLTEPAEGVEVAKLRCGEPPVAVGTKVRAEGYPGLINGQIAAWGRIATLPILLPPGSPWGVPVYTLQLPVAGGDSGGPVFAPDGRVFALMGGYPQPQPGWSFAIPVTAACAILSKSA